MSKKLLIAAGLTAIIFVSSASQAQNPSQMELIKSERRPLVETILSKSENLEKSE